MIFIKTLEWSFLRAPVYRFWESLCFSFRLLRTDVVCWLHCLLYETSVLSRGATELQAAKASRSPCEQRNNTPFDMRSGNTAKENKCFHCSETRREISPSLYICSWFDSQDEPRTLSLIDFRCQRQANNEGSIGIYQEVLQGCPWAFLLQVFSSLFPPSHFFPLFSPSLRPPPFRTRELRTPRVNIIALKLKAPTSSPHTLALEWDSMHFLITWPSLINPEERCFATAEQKHDPDFSGL